MEDNPKRSTHLPDPNIVHPIPGNDNLICLMKQIVRVCLYVAKRIRPVILKNLIVNGPQKKTLRYIGYHMQAIIPRQPGRVW